MIYGQEQLSEREKLIVVEREIIECEHKIELGEMAKKKLEELKEKERKLIAKVIVEG